MTDETKQTVVEDKTDDSATPSQDGQKPNSEATDARKDDNDLDKLLAEFDEETKSDKSSPNSEQKPDQSQNGSLSADEVQEWRRQQAEAAVQKELGPAMKKVRDANVPLSDQQVRALLERRIVDDPKLTNAWQNRNANRAAWSRVADNLVNELTEQFQNQPDRGATEDRDAVTAAVRNASTKAPEGKPPDYSRLSDREFADQVEKDTGVRPPI